MDYQEELKRSMNWLAEQKDTIFIGQSVGCPGTKMYKSVQDIDQNKRCEFPVAENLQIGYCTGLGLQGFVPVSIFPRFNFLLLAVDQLVNHLDRIPLYSKYRPKVIIRTAVGSNSPLDPGPQHQDDFTEAFQSMLKCIKVVRLLKAEDIFDSYQSAYNSEYSTLLVETG